MPRTKTTRRSRRTPNLTDFFLETVPYYTRTSRKLGGKKVYSREYMSYQKRGYSLPEMSDAENPQKIEAPKFNAPPIRNWTIPLFTIPCPNFKFTNGFIHSEEIPFAHKNTFLTITKNNQFSFEFRLLDQFWSAIRARNLSTGDQTINHTIPVPNFWNTPFGVLPMGMVSQTADQQGYIEIPGYNGLGVTFDRHVNVLFYRSYPFQKEEYAIMKFGVRPDSNGLIFMPMYQFGFEKMLLTGSQPPYPKLQRLFDIESLPNYTYLVGTVKDLEKSTVQIFRVEIQTGEVKSFPIVNHGLDVSKVLLDSKKIKISIDHTLFKKTGTVRMVVLISNHIVVLQEDKNGDFKILKDRYPLPVADPKENEWQDIAANCGNLFANRQTEPSLNALSNIKSDDLVIFDYLTGFYRDALLKDINFSDPKVNGFGLMNPVGGGLFMQEPTKGILAGLDSADSKIKITHFKFESD